MRCCQDEAAQTQLFYLPKLKWWSVQERLCIHDAKEDGSRSYTYLDLCIYKYPEWPSHQDLATQVKISKSYARKAIIELEKTRSLSDPEATKSGEWREREII
jgi:hypothetical protein